jgi:hypothetical protein
MRDYAMNQSFLFKSIRKYNQARRQTQKDAILHAVGVHLQLLQMQRSPLPTLNDDERQLVLEKLREFLKTQELEILLKP